MPARRPERLPQAQIDELEAAWHAHKATKRARQASARRPNLVDRMAASALAERFAFRSGFDLHERLNSAAADYLAHTSLDVKGEVAKLERRERRLLRTLRRRLGGRHDRVKATLVQLGVRGNVGLAARGWNGDPAHPSLASAVKKALADAEKRGRFPTARALWALALACIYAEGTGTAPIVSRSKSGAGVLADFIAACNATVSIKPGAISLSTLRDIANSEYVAHFLAKKAAPF